MPARPPGLALLSGDLPGRLVRARLSYRVVGVASLVLGIVALPLLLLSSPLVAARAASDLRDAADRLDGAKSGEIGDAQAALEAWSRAHARFVDSVTMVAVVAATVTAVLIVPVVLIGVLTSGPPMPEHSRSAPEIPAPDTDR